MPVQFPSGAVRGSAGASGYYMLPEAPFRRYAAAMEEGIAKYPRYNWLKGIPADNLFDHIINHLFLFLQGDTTEDHLGHAIWNLGSLIHFAETRPDLFADMPPGCYEATERWANAKEANEPDPLTVQTGHSSVCPNCGQRECPRETHAPVSQGVCELADQVNKVDSAHHNVFRVPQTGDQSQTYVAEQSKVSHRHTPRPT